MQPVALAAHEERRPYAARGENVEHLGRALGVGAVVESDCQLLHEFYAGGPTTGRSLDGGGGWKLSSTPETSW